jgi:hypothetical protein
VTITVLFVVTAAALEHFEVGVPWSLRALLIVALAFFYVLPLAVETVQAFRAGLREDGDLQT